ncbi:MAG TPA: magnesium transporter [Gemmatimonadaceae bacterium]|nr:magnesium transporter [Gemmatimonadaceae bacterium]
MRTDLTPTPELLYLLAGDPAELTETLSGMRAADIAEALGKLAPDAAARILTMMPFDLAVQVLDAPELEDRTRIIQALAPDAAAAFLEAMSADQRAEIFRQLPEMERQRFLRMLGEEDQRALSLLLQYPPESAGGIMTTEFVTVPALVTVDEVLRHISEVGRAKETVYAIYVTDPETQRLVHVVALRDLLTADRSAPVGRIGDRRKPIAVPPLADREDVARLIAKYDLLAVPVVDDGGHVLGIVTVDDMIDALVAEQTEDVQRFGGMQAIDQPYLEASLGTVIRKRGIWLSVLFLGQTLTATAMGIFESEIERAVVLAIFVPLIISSGGNTGSQATSLIIRAMALREVVLRDWWRVALRELPAGAVLGAMLGLLGFLRIVLWQLLGWYDYGTWFLLIGLVVALSLIGVVALGSLIGSMLPFALRRLGLDPASASAPFVATLVDVTGIMIYFGVAYVLLRGTVL